MKDNNRLLTIAIDGPAGAGKSSIAKVISEKLGYLYIDTGAMYRAVTWAVLDKKTDVTDEKSIEALLPNLQLEMQATASGLTISVWGQDITEAIRSARVTDSVSLIASYAKVRQFLVDEQRRLAAVGGVVLDGRDIASVVLPQADVKIYLTASVDVRAKRRWLELQAKGRTESLEEIKQSVESRDAMDKGRKESPLVCVPEAIIVDSSNLTFEETVNHMLELISKY